MTGKIRFQRRQFWDSLNMQRGQGQSLAGFCYFLLVCCPCELESKPSTRLACLICPHRSQWKPILRQVEQSPCALTTTVSTVKREKKGCHVGGQGCGRARVGGGRGRVLFSNSGRFHPGYRRRRSDGHRMVPKSRLQRQNTSPGTSQSCRSINSARNPCPKGKVRSGSAFGISQGRIKSSSLPSNYSNAMGLHRGSPCWRARWKGLNHLR